jgi:hypothetical protein
MMRYWVVAAVLVLGFASDQPAAAQDRVPPVLRVGMDTRAPPWSYVPGLDYAQEDPARDPVLTEAQLQKVEGLELGYDAGLRKADALLLSRIQAAVKDLVASGEGERIRMKWEGAN